ncbi:hypothetical protein [Spongorhabdus nitratireducens]
MSVKTLCHVVLGLIFISVSANAQLYALVQDDFFCWFNSVEPVDAGRFPWVIQEEAGLLHHHVMKFRLEAFPVFMTLGLMDENETPAFSVKWITAKGNTCLDITLTDAALELYMREAEIYPAVIKSCRGAVFQDELYGFLLTLSALSNMQAQAWTVAELPETACHWRIESLMFLRMFKLGLRDDTTELLSFETPLPYLSSDLELLYYLKHGKALFCASVIQSCARLLTPAVFFHFESAFDVIFAGVEE